jgi:hypothetical protein
VIDAASKIAAAAGDPAVLLALAIELAQENASLAERAAGLEAAEVERKAKQNRRVRRHRHGGDGNVTSRDETLQSVTQRVVTDGNVSERDATAPLPPAPSLLSPTPPNNPSSPPIPAAQLSTREVEPEESRLLNRIPVAAAVVRRMLDGFAGVQRTSWVGRLHGVLDRPPHPTDAELHDALEDMLTKPRDQWGPRFLRACVESIRQEGARGGKAGGKVPAAEARAAVLLALFRQYDLFAYSGDAAAYELKVYAASQDPQAGARFRAELNAVEPWKGIEAPSDFLKLREIAARLTARAA